jgi:hypothetical protein
MNKRKVFNKRKVSLILLFVVPFVLCFLSCEQYTTNVLNGLITVVAGHWVSYYADFTKKGHLVGNFSASGGTGNDIKVYVMDASNYTTWTSGGQASALYNSGQVHDGSFNVAVESGRNYVIYDNTFSLISDKQVTTKVDVKQ